MGLFYIILFFDSKKKKLKVGGLCLSVVKRKNIMNLNLIVLIFIIELFNTFPPQSYM